MPKGVHYNARTANVADVNVVNDADIRALETSASPLEGSCSSLHEPNTWSTLHLVDDLLCIFPILWMKTSFMSMIMMANQRR